jgi:hypothetical protein
MRSRERREDSRALMGEEDVFRLRNLSIYLPLAHGSFMTHPDVVKYVVVESSTYRSCQLESFANVNNPRSIDASGYEYLNTLTYTKTPVIEILLAESFRFLAFRSTQTLTNPFSSFNQTH